MEPNDSQASNITLLFAEIAKKLAVYLVIILFFNGLVAFIRFSELDGPTKTFAFVNGNFLVNGEVMGIPFFGLVNFILVTATLGSAVLNWSRKVKSIR